VTPIITINNPIVLVKRSYTNPKRQPVILQTDDATFDGSGTLNISPSGTINFFDAASGGNPVADGATFRGGQLGSTTTIFAEGANPSAAMNDVTLTLTLAPGTKPVKPPATATLTSVRVTLDICMSRTAAGTDPTPLSQDDKINVGRFLRVQQGNTAHRGMVIVRKAEPDVFPGNLVLNPLDGKVAVFAESDEVPAGQSPLGRHTIANGPIDSTAGAKRWAEAASVSGALRDTGFQLGVDGVDDDGDRVAITAFTVDEIDANLAVTPCKRGGTPPGTVQTQSSTTDARTFGGGGITVLKGCGDMKLKATARPVAVPLTWLAQRAADDTGLTGLPSNSAGASDKERILKTDATGSFNMMAFVDANGSGNRDPENDGLTLNVSMVNIEIMSGAASNQIFARNTLFNDNRSSGANLIVDSGTLGVPATNSLYTDALFTQHAMGIKVTVKLTGGGADQRRGTASAGVGFIQDFRADNFTGTYADGKTVKEVFDSSAPPPTFILPGATPTLLAFPVRDHRGTASNGSNTFINSSSDADTSNIAAGGQQRIVRVLDSPAIVLPMRHPVVTPPAVTGAALASISGSNDFTLFLVAFSNDFDQNFTVFAKADWSATYGSFTGGPPPAAGWTNTGAAITAGAAMDTSGMPQTGEASGMERCPPGATDNLKLDAR
jgi:hypothetical protein